jgi:hypothetical protein
LLPEVSVALLFTTFPKLSVAVVDTTTPCAVLSAGGVYVTVTEIEKVPSLLSRDDGVESVRAPAVSEVPPPLPHACIIMRIVINRSAIT